MHGITWKVGGGKNENFDGGKKKLISAERSEAEIFCYSQNMYIYFF